MAFGKYNIITTREQLSEVDEYLTGGGYDRFAVDTETSGLKFWQHPVIGISFSVNSSSGHYIPFLFWEPDESSKKTKKIKKESVEVFENGHFKCVWTGNIYPENVTNKEYQYPDFIVEYLKKWMVYSKPQIIMHNAPFDVLMIEHSLGINLQDQVFVDTVLLKHVIDENSSNGLKETAILWSKELGIPVEEQANKEQIEMGSSVIRNGGSWTKRQKHVWRGDLELVGKYACSDTFLTFGLFEVGIDKLINEYEPKHLEWFFEDEVMPLCRNVVIPMRRRGVPIDVKHFQEMEKETREKMLELEDQIISQITKHISDFDIGTSINEIATKKALVQHIIKTENLEYPSTTNKKTGITKNTLGKAAIEKLFAETNHWLWGYLLGENELPYNEVDLENIKKQIYVEKTGKRYQFNISSDMHLRWLFCKKLGYDPKTLPQTESATKKNIIPSMKAEVLKQFFYKDHSFVKALLLFKKLQKLHSTYILPALELHNNGLLHMDMMQSGTISGRFACRGGFNLQTLPRVEDLSRCPKCDSKNVLVVNPIKLVAVLECADCGHLEEDIICPSAIKLGFVAPKGCKIVNADYSSLEPRIFSQVSGDPKLKEIYLKNLDLYSSIYISMMEPEGPYSADPKAPNFLKKLAPEKRTLVKPAVLSIPYGARGPQVAKLMNFRRMDTRNGLEFPDVERGKEFRNIYLNTYPDLHKSMERSIVEACSNGLVETMIGRRRHYKFTVPIYNLLSKAGITIDEFLDASKKTLDFQEVDKEYMTLGKLKELSAQCGFNLKDEKGIPRTWAFVKTMFKHEINNTLNIKIQGLAAHIMNRAMIELAGWIEEKGMNSYIGLTVHDEVTVLAPENEVEEISKMLQYFMENNKYAKLIEIPMIAEPIVCDNLRDSK